MECIFVLQVLAQGGISILAEVMELASSFFGPLPTGMQKQGELRVRFCSLVLDRRIGRIGFGHGDVLVTTGVIAFTAGR